MVMCIVNIPLCCAEWDVRRSGTVVVLFYFFYSKQLSDF